jgi:hypothetical protein
LIHFYYKVPIILIFFGNNLVLENLKEPIFLYNVILQEFQISKHYGNVKNGINAYDGYTYCYISCNNVW